MSKEIPCQKCGHVWLWAGWKKQKDAFCPEGHGCNSKTKDSIEQLAATNKQLEAKLAKAVEALDEAVYLLAPDDKDMMRKAGVYRIVTTLAELKGEK